MEEKLSYKNIVKLINLYRLQPVLWDMNNKFYKDKDLKAEAYEKIAKEMRMMVEVVKKKIRSLRITYTSEKRKMKLKKSGPGAEGNYITSLRWFDEMSFLDNFIIIRKIVDNSVKNNINSESCDDDFKDSINKEHFENHTPRSFENSTPIKATSNNLDKALGNPPNENESEFVAFGSSVSQELQENNSNSVSCDEFEESIYGDHFEKYTPISSENNNLDKVLGNPLGENEGEFVAFGSSVAQQLQTVPVEVAYELMGKIQNLITKRKIKYIRQSRTAPRTSTISAGSTPRSNS